MEPTCPACGAEDDHIFLGTLGRLDHYRCRACGITFSRVVPEPDPADIEEENES